MLLLSTRRMVLTLSCLLVKSTAPAPRETGPPRVPTSRVSVLSSPNPTRESTDPTSLAWEFFLSSLRTVSLLIHSALLAKSSSISTCRVAT
jgi:hypothetical protein